MTHYEKHKAGLLQASGWEYALFIAYHNASEADRIKLDNTFPDYFVKDSDQENLEALKEIAKKRGITIELLID